MPAGSIKSLDLYEARQRIKTLGEELRYYRNLAARQKRYIDTQMKPLVQMGIVQGGKIKTLERKIRRLTQPDWAAAARKMKTSPNFTELFAREGKK